MRWCLKLKGIKEKNEENIRTDIIHLFAKIAPDIDMRQLEDAVDIVHRIGRKEDNKNRHVVILFARRLVREGDMAPARIPRYARRASASPRCYHWRTERRGRICGRRLSKLAAKKETCLLSWSARIHRGDELAK
ncbi:hypothetical protein DPEC_G00370010 [Dallia pectoralis]|nr:hypothetical protein DPEC_G00370010 [Dallia pectoralis]